ncbi:YesL family protein [Bacillus infantis]|uniref:YesL family protein n=1 Tax=Bacillus infantis TaxID=324767 RepID=UPI003CF40AC1
MVSSVLYRIFEWITRFAYMNLLWILFTLSGGILFGFFPSTLAMFAITRDWLRGKTGTPLFPSFLSYYKKDFWKGNRLGFIIIITGSLAGFNLWFTQAGFEVLTWAYVPLLAFMMIFLLFLLYLFPVFVHFDLNVRQLIKQALLIMLVNPLHTVLMILCLASLYYITQLAPALGFIFGGSASAFVIMWLCLHAFNRIQRKQAKQKTLSPD